MGTECYQVDKAKNASKLHTYQAGIAPRQRERVGGGQTLSGRAASGPVLPVLRQRVGMQRKGSSADLSLPRSQNLEWMARLRGHCPGAKLILLSVHDEPGVCRLALAAGADGFLLKRSLGSELLPAVDAVLQGNRYVALALAGKVPLSPAPAPAHLEKDQAP